MSGPRRSSAFGTDRFYLFIYLFILHLLFAFVSILAPLALILWQFSRDFHGGRSLSGPNGCLSHIVVHHNAQIIQVLILGSLFIQNLDF